MPLMVLYWQATATTTAFVKGVAKNVLNFKY